MKLRQLYASSLQEPGKLIAIAVLVFSLIFFLLQLASIFEKEPPVREIKLAAVPVNTQLAVNEKSPMLTAALFGIYTPHLSDNDIKQSTLDFTVVGILYSAEEKKSYVILRVAGGEERNYLVGDTLPGSVLIKRITKKGIVVLHNGVLERLSLPKNTLLFSSPPKPLIKE